MDNIRSDSNSLVDKQIQEAVRLIESANLDKRNGLPQSLFLCISSLIVIANVDLFILDKAGRLLLSYRDDEYYGAGWHIPGGCLRFGETMVERIHKTAMLELGVDVTCNESPLAVRDVIREPLVGVSNPDVRGHNLAVLFLCSLSTKAEKRIAKSTCGRLKWFNRIPEDSLSVLAVYNDIFEKYGLR